MRKILVLVLLLMVSPVFALTLESGDSEQLDAPSLNVQLAKYEPYPAEAEKYVTLWFKIENTGIGAAANLTTILNPEFPFYIDDTEKLEKNYGRLRAKSDILVEYRIRVSKDAPDGRSKIELKYTTGNAGLFEKNFTITVDKKPTNAELIPLFVGVEPFAYPTGSSELTVDIANVAPGTAYYTVVKVSSPAAEIKRNKIFIGTLDADDFDSVDFTLDFKNVTPGRHPVNIEMTYKNEDWKEIKSNGTVYVDLVSLREARKRQQKPVDPLLVVGAVIAVILGLKFIVWPLGKRGYSAIKSRIKK